MKNYKYAWAAGLLVVIYHSVTTMFMGDLASMSPEQWQTLELLGFGRYVLIISGVFTCVWLYRTESVELPSFKRLIVVGVTASTILAHIVGIAELLYVLTHPNFFELYMKAQEMQMRHAGLSQEHILATKQAAESMKMMQTPLANGIFYFVETFLLGAVSALLAALAVRRRRPLVRKAT